MARRKKYVMRFSDRPQLSSVFSSWLEDISSRSKRRGRGASHVPYVYSDWDDICDFNVDFDDVVFPFKDDDEYYDDSANAYWDEYFSSIRGGKGKSGVKRDSEKCVKSRRQRFREKIRSKHDIVYEGDDSFLSIGHYGDIHIYYYDDVDDVYSAEEFTSLSDFDDFCSSKGFTVSEGDANDIAYTTDYHCCISPYDKEHGRLVIIGGPTYTDMMERYDYLSSFSSTSKHKASVGHVQD